MNSNYLEKLKEFIPSELWSKRISLAHIFGVNEFAWSYSEAIQLIEIFANLDFIVLGGDVYRLIGDELEITYDSWYAKVEKNIEGVTIAKNQAIKYINAYHKNNGDNFVYTLVYSELDAI